MPACHANWGCFSRKRTFGEGDGAASCKAMAMARDAGPNPTQRRSRVVSGEELASAEAEVRRPFGVWPLLRGDDERWVPAR